VLFESGIELKESEFVFELRGSEFELEVMAELESKYSELVVAGLLVEPNLQINWSQQQLAGLFQASISGSFRLSGFVFAQSSC
jgi:hypothetical protein